MREKNSKQQTDIQHNKKSNTTILTSDKDKLSFKKKNKTLFGGKKVTP